MPNVASVLKEEISRVARIVLRSEIDLLRKSVASPRSQIADLKRRLLQAEKALGWQVNVASRHVEVAQEKPPLEGTWRCSAKGLKKQRQGWDCLPMSWEHFLV
jgi:hypothetical protein